MQVECAQHSTHHYGPLEPYSLGSKEPDYEELRRNVRGFKKTPEWVPDELKNSIRLDEELTGFKWTTQLIEKRSVSGTNIRRDASAHGPVPRGRFFQTKMPRLRRAYLDPQPGPRVVS